MKPSRRFDVPRSAVALALAVLAVVAGIGLYANLTVRSVEDRLPAQVLEQQRDIALMVHALADLTQAVEAAELDPTDERRRHLAATVDTAVARLREIRKTYTFDSLLHASAVHATVNPALTDIGRWLAEGASGYGPTSQSCCA